MKLDLDWSLADALRRQWVSLVAFAALLVVGIVVAASGWSLAGTLLILAGLLGFVSRILVGMLDPADGSPS